MKPIYPILLVAVLLTACLPASSEAVPQRAWKYADLRFIDPVDSLDPEADLTAVYLREHSGEIQIRLDMLDLDPSEPFDLRIAFDTHGEESGSTETHWDFWILAKQDGAVESWRADGGNFQPAGLRIVREHRFDTITISLDKESLKTKRTGFRIGVFLNKVNSLEELDAASPIASNSPPPAPVPVLFAFRNTMNASTPAQAVRAWDGAHSGPSYDRHGLKHLIQAASEWNIPIALLDLAEPRALAALEYVGAFRTITEAAELGIVSLPQTLGIPAESGYHLIQPDAWALQKAFQVSKDTRTKYNLPGSRFLYSPVFPHQLFDMHDGVRRPELIITEEQGGEGSSVLEVQCRNWQGTNILTLPSTTGAGQQTSDDGLSLETRAALVSAALDPGNARGCGEPYHGQILYLGGDLAQSNWGDPEAARVGFSYLASRPWIRPISLSEAASLKPNQAFLPLSPGETQEGIFSTSTGAPGDDSDPSHLQGIILEALRNAQPGVLTDAAWQMYASLAAPALFENAQYYQVRLGYLGQIGYLLEGAEWAAQPPEMECPGMSGSSCVYTSDPDWDGEAEIMLASRKFLAIIEQRGGYLAAFFYRDGRGVHQIIAPASQFATGLSDPITWKLDQGARAEPDLPRGAFSDIRLGRVEPAWETMPYELSNGQVTFTASEGITSKTIALNSDGIQVTYLAETSYRVQNALAIDPWQRFEPGWANRYKAEQTPTGWAWELDKGPRVELRTEKSGSSEDIMIEMSSFLSALSYANQPEDPFIDYGKGYFLPFPMAIVDVEAGGEFVIRISISSVQELIPSSK